MTQTCQQCGAALPGHTAAWLCPKCLLRQAATPVDSTAEASSDTDKAALPRAIHYFGDYELLQEIARGGMGVVYKARQISLNRIVAVKMLLFGKLAGNEFTKRFRAEAEAAASLQHPNIVAIHEVGEHEGQQYFSMDYVEGPNLAALVGEKPLTPRRAAEYLRSVAEAIHYAHQRGILHRDLKPSNVLIDANEQPRVTDFGLAKRLAGTRSTASQSVPTKVTDAVERLPAEDLTLTGQVLGTPHYMPPEQAGGKRGDVSAASDVYSLGAILYHLLTGRPPFLADSIEGALAQLLHNEPASPRLLNPGIPRDLETVCLKCLNKEPGRRYQSALALTDELTRWLNNEPIRARPIGPSERLVRWCRRKPALAGLAVALLLVAGAGLSGILWQWQRAEQHATRESTQRVRAEEALTLLELQRAEDLLEKDEITMGVAYLARIVRLQPTNRVAAQRLLSALTQRDFALPVGPPLPHDRKVSYAEFSPDGRRVVTAALDFHARIWDARTGEPLTPPMVHENAVRFARFSPNGSLVLTFADDHRAYLWNAANGYAVGRPMSHPKTIHAAHFSPDGGRVLTASEDGTARLWAARTGQPVSRGTLRHAGAVVSAGFNHDGSRIVTASKDNVVQIWDAATLQPLGKPFRPGAGVSMAEFSPDGRWVVIPGWDSSYVWDVASGEPLAKPHVHAARIHTARFSPDGERIVTAPSTGAASLWQSRDWAPLARLLQHRAQVNSIEFSPEGQRLLTGSFDHTARLWDAASGKPLSPPMQHDGLVWSARFSPDGLFAVTASADQTARIWDVRPGAIRSQPMRHTGPVVAAEFSPDGEWVVTASSDTTAKLWNARTAEQIGPPLQHEARITVARFNPDGQRVATGSAGGARIWDVQTGRAITDTLRHERGIVDLQFSPDGRLLATASADETVRIWNAQTGEPHGAPIPHQHTLNFVCFSPDGKRLLSSDHKDDVAQIHEVATGRLLAETPKREGQILHGEFSPDGQRAVTASEDGTARIWNAHTGQPLIEPLRHKGVIRHARFSRDGRWVVTASEDSTAQVWDSATGQALGEPLRHRGAVNTAEFSPDGRLVVTASDDGTARLWDAFSGRPVTESFSHHAKVYTARFSPDGRRVLTASRSGSGRVWDVPPIIRSADFQPATPRIGNLLRYEEASGLLADLAEALIGKRVNAQGALASVSSARLGEVRQRIAKLPRDADFTRWLEWFFADRNTRTISPYSAVSLPRYIQARAEETDVVSWREALLLCPTNGIAFAQMAGHHLRQNPAPAPPDVACADWASRQAVQFATERSQPWQRRIEVMEHTGGWTQLLAEAEQVIQSQPANADAWISKSRCLTELGQFEAVAQPYNAVFWNAKGVLHEKAGQIRQAEAAFAKAIEVASLPAVSWDFESGRASPNWKPIHDMANIIVQGGNLSFDNTGGDPHLELYLPPVDGTAHRWFHVRMKNATSGKRAEVFWGTVRDPEFHEARVVEFPILPNDRQFTVYTVDMGHQAWTNKNRIVRLRFDPVFTKDERGHIDIDWICLHTDSKPPAVVSGWVEIVDPEMRRLALSNLERLRRK